MNATGITPILNVSDVVASIGWFERLGWTCSFTYNPGGIMPTGVREDAHGPAVFAGVCAGAAQVFQCRDAQGLRGGKPARLDGDDDFGATWMSVWLETPAEVDAAHRLALDAGIAVYGRRPTSPGARASVA